MSQGNGQDRTAWMRSMLDRHEGPLLRYAARITGCADAARDVVQETFLRFCSDGAPADEPHATAWLYRVCRHRALDARRKDQRMTTLTAEVSRSVACEAAPPADSAEKRETTSRLMALLAQLPDRQQEIVRLRFQAGLSYRQISEVMQITVTNVGYLIHTAMRSLREQMAATEEPTQQNAESQP